MVKGRNRRAQIKAIKFKAAIQAQRPGQAGFVRYKKIGGQPYLYHVESERTGPKDNEVKQNHISYLGKATPALKKQFKVRVPR